MKPFFTTLHRWLGFPLGILFVITFGTGCINGIGELINRFNDGQFNADFTYRQTSIEEDAAALTLLNQNAENIRAIVMPTLETPYYQVVTSEHRATYPIDNLNQPRIQPHPEDGLFDTIEQLHRNLLLGKTGFFGIHGKHLMAWVSLLSLFLSLIGLWLWWPKRRTFDAKLALPRGNQRRHFYSSHLTGGVIIILPIVLLALTGAAITYRPVAQQLLVTTAEKPQTKQAITLENNWHAWLQASYAQMPPEARLSHIRFPRANRKNSPQLLSLRFNSSDDWSSMAGSEVKIDQKLSQLVESNRFGDLSIGEKLYAMIKPLHTGEHLPVSYSILLVLLSLLGTITITSGILSFIRKKRKFPKIKGVRAELG